MKEAPGRFFICLREVLVLRVVLGGLGVFVYFFFFFFSLKQLNIHLPDAVDGFFFSPSGSCSSTLPLRASGWRKHSFFVVLSRHVTTPPKWSI